VRQAPSSLVRNICLDQKDPGCSAVTVPENKSRESPATGSLSLTKLINAPLRCRMQIFTSPAKVHSPALSLVDFHPSIVT
jgi:hypothetical protein